MKWSDEMDGFFRETVPGHSSNEIRAAFAERFGVVLTDSQIQNKKTALGLKSGINPGRFQKGIETWNKGMKPEDWMCAEGLERFKSTQFKNGNIPKQARPIGSERLDIDCYTYVKVRDRPENGERTFVLKHVRIWEQAHGMKVPNGHHVRFADGDKNNFDPENLVLVSNANGLAINNKGMEYADKETLENAAAICEIERKTKQIRKGK